MKRVGCKQRPRFWNQHGGMFGSFLISESTCGPCRRLSGFCNEHATVGRIFPNFGTSVCPHLSIFADFEAKRGGSKHLSRIRNQHRADVGIVPGFRRSAAESEASALAL